LVFLMEGRDKPVAGNSDQNRVSQLESLREQVSMARVQEVKGSSKSHKLVFAVRSGQVRQIGENFKDKAWATMGNPFGFLETAKQIAPYL